MTETDSIRRISTRRIRIPAARLEDADWLRDTLLAAGAAIRRGELVAFPTETVYGLGCNALDAEAAKRVYAAKGRPSDNPLIVHVAEAGAVQALFRELPPLLLALMARFSPGPLTYILPKSDRVPKSVSGGLDTVAVRIPEHPVALAFLRAAAVPVAAPSANRSGRPSPTTAEAVLDDLDGRICAVIDAGPCDFGVESTVLDLSRLDRPRILRPGALRAEDLQAFLAGCPDFHPSRETWREELRNERPAPDRVHEAVRSPGMKYRHYAPSRPVRIVRGQDLTARLASLEGQLNKEGTPCAAFLSEELADLAKARLVALERLRLVRRFSSRDGGRAAAHGLFRCLRDFDRPEIAAILVEELPPTGYGFAYMNRLKKASGEAGGQNPENCLSPRPGAAGEDVQGA